MSDAANVLTLGAERPKRPWWVVPQRWRNPIGIVGAVVVLLTILVAIAAPLIAPYDPDAQLAMRLLPPSSTSSAWSG